MKKEKVVSFIPVRGGSKSIPLKNIKELYGKPLVYWVIEAALECKYIDKVYVATDSDEIKNCINKITSTKLSVIGRSFQTATDTATSESALIEFCEKYDFENVFFMQATSPLLTSNDLDAAWETYVSKKKDSILSVVKNKRFYWKENNDNLIIPLNYDPLSRPRRQDFEGCYMENGAFYLSSRKSIIDSGCRISGRIGIFEMPPYTSFEVDEPDDWIIIKDLMRRYKQVNNKGEIKLFATDVDGVLTDAGMYYSEDGDEMKKFNTHDAKGLELLRNLGIKTAIFTSEDTKLVERRAEKMKIDFVNQGVKDKLHALKKMCVELKISLNEVAYIGDDINDTDVLRNVKFSACPADAIESIKSVSQYICKTNGGHGCVREFIDTVIIQDS